MSWTPRKNPAIPSRGFCCGQSATPGRNSIVIEQEHSPMTSRIDSIALATLFTDARTHNAWAPTDVPDSLLREVVEVMRWAPTSVNTVSYTHLRAHETDSYLVC